jgi:hypothetical protein
VLTPRTCNQIRRFAVNASSPLKEVMMSNTRVPILARAMLVITLGAAVPMALVSAKEAPAPALKKTKKPKGVGLPKPKECTLVETGKSICEKNAYGDEVCQPELVEECPQPL